jgi:hypothetical protein
LVGRPEGKRPVGIPRHRWEDNIKMDIRETGIDGTNWIRLAQDRVPCSDSIKKADYYLIFDKLSDYQLFKEYPAPWSKYMTACLLARFTAYAFWPVLNQN